MAEKIKNKIKFIYQNQRNREKMKINENSINNSEINQKESIKNISPSKQEILQQMIPNNNQLTYNKNEKIVDEKFDVTIVKFAVNLHENRKRIKYNDYIIQIISSIVSYMKIFLDRFLDYLYNGILFYLLKNILQTNLTKYIKYSFSDMDDKTVISIMGGDSETIKKIQRTEKSIVDLESVYRELNNL